MAPLPIDYFRSSIGANVARTVTKETTMVTITTVTIT